MLPSRLSRLQHFILWYCFHMPLSLRAHYMPVTTQSFCIYTSHGNIANHCNASLYAAMLLYKVVNVGSFRAIDKVGRLEQPSRASYPKQKSKQQIPSQTAG